MTKGEIHAEWEKLAVEVEQVYSKRKFEPNKDKRYKLFLKECKLEAQMYELMAQWFSLDGKKSLAQEYGLIAEDYMLVAKLIKPDDIVKAEDEALWAYKLLIGPRIKQKALN